jgi:hypothetical protein
MWIASFDERCGDSLTKLMDPRHPPGWIPPLLNSASLSRAKRLSKASECRHRVVCCRTRPQSGCDHKWPGPIPWSLRDRPGWEPRGGHIGSPLHPRFRYPSHTSCLSASEKELRLATSPSAAARLSRRALLAGSPGPKPPFDGIEEKMGPQESCERVMVERDSDSARPSAQ